MFYEGLQHYGEACGVKAEMVDNYNEIPLTGQ